MRKLAIGLMFISVNAFSAVHIMQGDSVTASSVTVTGAGGLAVTNAAVVGSLTCTGSPCGTGTGGGSAVESFDGTTRISSETANFTFNGTQFIGTLVGAATASYSLDSSTVTLLGPSIALTSEVTGTLPVANGGTNLTASSDDNVMVGNGTTWQSKAIADCDTATTSKLLYDAGTNAFSCGTDQDSGAGSGTIAGLTDLQTSVAGATATIKTGRSIALDGSGLNVSTSHSEATITKQLGTDSGTFRIAVDYNGGTPQLKCYYGTGLTITNYTLVGITCASGNVFSENDFPLSTVDVSGGVLQTPTDLRGIAMVSPYVNGAGLSKAGNTLSANSAVVSFLDVSSTFTVKQNFTSSNTYAGINVGEFSGDPSPLENGDVWYNTSTNKFRCRENGASTNCVGAGGGSTIYTGAYADLEAQACASGDMYTFEDSTIYTMARCTATDTWGKIFADGKTVTMPMPVSSFTVVYKSSTGVWSTNTTGGGFNIIVGSNSVPGQSAAYVRSIALSTFTYTLGVKMALLNNYSNFSFGLSNGTGNTALNQVVTIGSPMSGGATPGTYVANFDSWDYSSYVFGPAPMLTSGVFYVRVRQAFHARYYEISSDRNNWSIIYETTKTTHITPTHWYFRAYGIGVVSVFHMTEE